MKPLSEMSVEELREYEEKYKDKTSCYALAAFDELARRLSECEKKARNEARNEAYERVAQLLDEEEQLCKKAADAVFYLYLKRSYLDESAKLRLLSARIRTMKEER